MIENNIIILRNRTKLGYAEYGDKDGKPLFFFHGWPGSRLQGKLLDSAAQKLGIRVISVDRPGYGLSEHKERTLLDWPDDIQELADKLKIKKFSVLGNSGGGPYSAVCAYKITNRLIKVGISVGLAPTNISGILDGMGFFNKITWYSYHKFPFIMNIASLLSLIQAKKIFKKYYSINFPSKADQKILESKKISEEMYRFRNEAYRQGKKGVLKDLQLYTTDWGFKVKDIKAKVYLWYGESDKNVSLKMGKYYESTIPDSQLTIYPGEGHLLIRKHAEEILKKLF